MDERRIRVLSSQCIAVCVVALMLPACGSSRERARQAELRKRVTAAYDQKTGRLQVLAYDSNGDGRPDRWSYMDGTRVLRVEIDRNFDGKVDRWEYFDEKRHLLKVALSARNDGRPDSLTYAAPDGTIAKIERATRGDGKVDRVEYYEKGVLVRAETDGDRDGRIDGWEYWEHGRLRRAEFDLEHRGRPTRRLIYDDRGALLRAENDSGDGRFVALAPGEARAAGRRAGEAAARH